MSAAPAAQLLPRFITIGFVGKRRLPQGEAALRQTLEQELDKLEGQFPGPAHVLVGLSALALGADTVFAEVVARRGQDAPVPGRPAYAQQVFLPAQPDDFFRPADFAPPGEPAEGAAAHAQATRAAACLHASTVLEVRITGQDRDRNERFAETGYEIVSECDLLLVACTRADKAAALGPAAAARFARGGSAETLSHAYAIGKALVIIELDGPPDAAGRLPVTAVPGRATGSPAQLGFGAPQELFGPGATAAPLAALRYPEALRAIHAQADELAVGTKGRFVGSSELMLLGHLLATCVAALALTYHFQGQPEQVASTLKFGLLLAVLVLAGRLHHRLAQTGWLEARQLAELTRAAQALLPRPDIASAGQPPLYPGGPRYLRDFHLPELAAFAKSLYLLHLREFIVRTGRNHYDYGAHSSATANDLARHYVQQRLDAPQSQGGQLAYFASARTLAARRLRRVTRWFFLCSYAAAAGALAALVRSFYAHAPAESAGHHAVTLPLSGWDGPLVLLLVKFLPLALPVAAAGLIAWIGLRDLDREVERYTDLESYLRDARQGIEQASTTTQLRRRIERLETTLLQELIEWRAKLKATHPG